MEQEKQEQTRVRIAYKVSAKGIFQPDITAECECVDTAMEMLKDGLKEVEELAKSRGEVAE